MHYQDAIAEIGITIKSLEARIERDAERFLSTVKALYEARAHLEREYEMVNKEKILIDEGERIRRALEVLKLKTPSGPLNKLD